MTPDLSPIQTIAIGVTITVVTLLVTVILITITYAYEVRSLLTRAGILTPAQVPRTNWRTSLFHRHYVIPEPLRRPTIWTDLGSITTTTLSTRISHKCMTTIWRSPSDKYFSSWEDLPPRNTTPGPSNVHQTPTLEPNLTTEARHIWFEEIDPWASTENAVPDPDPEYPTGVWNADNFPGRYTDRDQPVAILDLPDEPELHDPSPPYFLCQALDLSRSRPGLLHPKPTDHRPDPFAHLRRNTIPFPSRP